MSSNAKFHRSSLLALLGAFIAAISLVLPWATVQFNPISVTTQNLILPTLNIPASGFETIIYPTFASFFVVVISIALFTNDERRRMARGLLFIAGGFIMLMTYVYAISAAMMAATTVHDYYNAFTSVLNIQLQNYFPYFSISFGGYIAILGSVITIIAGLLAINEKQLSAQRIETPAPPPQVPAS